MSIPVAEKLLEQAKKGERLSPKERRHVIAFLMATNAEATNVELGQMFGVTERQIRLDKKSIREERSKLIREEDVGLVIADILMDYDRNIRDIERSKRHSKVGTPNFRQHCESAMKMRLDTVRALQDLGWLPKNLGNMTVAKFSYKAVVEKDGTVVSRPVDLVIEKQTEERLLTDGQNEIAIELPPDQPGTPVEDQ